MLLDSKGLSDKQERFCIEYILDFNATAAAKRSGLHPDTGSKLLKMPQIRDRIEQLTIDISIENSITKTYVLHRLTEVLEKCLQREPVYEWNLEKHCRERAKENGKDVYKFDSQGANKALELMGRYLGMFGRDNFQKANILSTKNELTDEQFSKLLNAALREKE